MAIERIGGLPPSATWVRMWANVARTHLGCSLFAGTFAAFETKRHLSATRLLNGAKAQGEPGLWGMVEKYEKSTTIREAGSG